MYSALVCSWKIDVWTAGKSFNLLREDSESDVLCSNTLLFKRKHMAHPHLLWGLGLKWNNIEIKTPSLESRAIHRIDQRKKERTHMRSIDPSLAKPWWIWRWCSYNNIVSRICLLTLLLKQTSKEACARANMNFLRVDQLSNGNVSSQKFAQIQMRYRFKSNQILFLNWNLYCKIPENLSFGFEDYRKVAFSGRRCQLLCVHRYIYIRIFMNLYWHMYMYIYMYIYKHIYIYT